MQRNPVPIRHADPNRRPPGQLIPFNEIPDLPIEEFTTAQLRAAIARTAVQLHRQLPNTDTRKRLRARMLQFSSEIDRRAKQPRIPGFPN